MVTEKLIVRPYQEEDQRFVVELWEACSLVVPQNNPLRDIERKLKVNPEMFLVGLIDGSNFATVMAGYEGHRGWINYLAVSPTMQRRGIAQQIMMEAENLLKSLGCPKINLQVRSSNSDVIGFYETLGYSVSPVIGLEKRLIQDDRS